MLPLIERGTGVNLLQSEHLPMVLLVSEPAALDAILLIVSACSVAKHNGTTTGHFQRSTFYQNDQAQMLKPAGL